MKLSLFCSIIITASVVIQIGQPYMIVVWASTTQLNNCLKKTNPMNLTSCVNLCSSNKLCVLAIFNVPSSACHLAMFGNVTTVSKSNALTGWVVGFKVKYDANVTQCAIGENPPTFNNQPAYGDLSTFDYYGAVRKYTISYSSGEWAIDYTEKLRCPAGFYYNQRPNVGWCMTTFLPGGEPLPPSQARIACPKKTDGGVLSGIGSATELSLIISQVNSYMKTMNIKNMYVILDGVRTGACLKKNCDNPQEFSTTDKYYTSFKYYNWTMKYAVGEPSGRNCLGLVFAGVFNGAADLIPCMASKSPPSIGYVCGRLALA